MAGVLSGNAALISSNGVEVIKADLKNGRTSLPVGDLPKGIYLLRVQTGRTIHTQKVAIE
jgi:hypothetical protein